MVQCKSPNGYYTELIYSCGSYTILASKFDHFSFMFSWLDFCWQLLSCLLILTKRLDETAAMNILVVCIYFRFKKLVCFQPDEFGRICKEGVWFTKDVGNSTATFFFSKIYKWLQCCNKNGLGNILIQ